MNSIPASQLVNVVPSVLGTGGSPLTLNGVFLTKSPLVPIGEVMAFPSVSDVGDFFGPTSDEAQLASNYFLGFDNSTRKPGTLYYAQYNDANVAGYLRSGSFESTSLAQLQALSGTVIISIDGRSQTSSAINLAGATSFSNAAALIQAGMNNAGGRFVGTAAQTAAADVLNVTAVTSGTLAVGDVITGTGVDSGLSILAFLTGTGGIGTYQVSTTTGFASTTINVAGVGTVSYSSQLDAFTVLSPTTGDDSAVGYATGTISTGVKFTAATGAILSAGADATTPAAAMDGVVDVTQNWATFMTVWEPLLADKLLFADWVNGVGPPARYCYVAWDTDIIPTQSPDEPASFGALTASFTGIEAIYGTAEYAAFFCGMVASINFQQTAGRITFAYKGQAGLTPLVTDATTADNLKANGYNYYAQYATANQQFRLYQPGQISGTWEWADPYINQIYLNSQFQLAFMSLLASVNSLPYNNKGTGQIRTAAMDPINEALNFGSIQTGVVLSAQQAAAVNTAAGLPIDGTLTNIGWYLQILPATAQVRGLRESPPMNFWYMDGGSVQKIDMASIAVL